MFGGFVDVGTAGRDDAEEEEGVVDEAVVVMVGDRDAGLLQLRGVGGAFVAKGVKFGGLDEGRREARRVATQGRGLGFGRLGGIGEVVVPEPLHRIERKHVAFAIVRV